MDKTKINSTVCTLFSRDKSIKEPLADEIRKLGINVIPLAMQSWRDLSTFKKFKQIIKNNKIDIVHGHSAQVDFWACFMSKILNNRKTVYTKHDIRKLQKFESNIPKFQYWLLNNYFSDKIIAVSDAIKYQLLDQYKISSRKITTIYNPVDTIKFQPNKDDGIKIRKEIGISANVPLIGCVSRLVSRKGFDIFLRSARIIIQKIPNAHFLIVGHGKEENNLRDLSKKLSIDQQIHWLIGRRDIPDILNAMDIFLFTTLWREGFGIVVIEAMACGLPIICSNVGPLREIVIDGYNGYLPEPQHWELEVNSANPQPFAEKVIYLLKNPTVARQMGKASRKRCESNFSAKSIVKQYEDLYRLLYN